MYEATIELFVNNVRTVHETESGVISFGNIPSGSTVRVNAIAATDTDYGFLRWEHIQGDIGISAFSTESGFIIPNGGVMMYAVFTPMFEDDSKVEPLEWTAESAGIRTPIALELDWDEVVQGTSADENENFMKISLELLENSEEENLTHIIERGSDDDVSGFGSYEFDASPLADIFRLELHAGAWWNATSNVNWLTTTPLIRTPPHMNDLLQINVAENTTNAERRGRVRIDYNDGGPPDDIFITQEHGPALFLDRTSIPIPEQRVGFETIVSSNRAWNVSNTSTNRTWFSISPTSGNRNGEFTVIAEPHAGHSIRQGEVTVSVPGVPAITKTMSIFQAPGNGLVLSAMAGETWANPSRFAFSVFSDRTWNMPTSNASWLIIDTFTPSNRNGNGAFAVITTANTGNTERTGIITVTAQGAPTRTITIKQLPGSVLFVSANRAEAPPTPSFGEIEVTSSGSWTVESNQPSWLSTSRTSGSGNGMFTVYVEENTDTMPRIGELRIRMTGSPTQIIRIVQFGRTAVLTLSANTWNLTAATAISDPIRVITDATSWNALVGDGTGWLSVSDVTANSFRIRATANTSFSDRRGTILVNAGNITRPVVVSQAGTNVTLSLDRAAWTPDHRTQYVTVNVTANGTWNTPTSDRNWLWITNVTNQMGNGSFRINAEPNPGGERTGEIRVTRGNVTQTVRVTQAASTTATNSINTATWIRENVPPYDFYITSAPASFAEFSNAYFGMSRHGNSGRLYIYSNLSGWIFVDRITFVPGSPTRANLAAGMSFTFTNPAATQNPPDELDGFYNWLNTLTFYINDGLSERRLQPFFAYSPSEINRVGELPHAPTRVGWNFAGWFSTPTGSNRITEITEILSTRTFYAQWTRAIPQLPEVNVRVNLLRHASFNTSFGSGAEAIAGAKFSEASQVFFRRWGLRFTPTQSTAPLVFAIDNDCPHGYYLECDTNCPDYLYFSDNCLHEPSQPCNSTCREYEYCTLGCTFRHKCGHRLWSDLLSAFPTDNRFEINTLLFTFSACASYAEVNHATVNTTNATDPSTEAYLWNVRRIQHEWSHLFNIPDNNDNSCIDVNIEWCLMNTGYDDIYVYDQPSIWCRNCEARFDTNRFR